MNILFSNFVLFLAVSFGTVNLHAIEDFTPLAKDQKTKKLLKEEIKSVDYGKRGYLLDLKLSQRADVWDSELENSFRYRVYFEPYYEVKLSDNFYFDVRTGLGTTIGSVQSRFGDLRADDAIILRDSRFFFRKSWSDMRHWLKLSVGAIDQFGYLKDGGLSILMSRRALPGFEQIYKFENKYKKDKSFGFDLRSFQGVPTSQSISLDFNEKEDVPFYFNSRLELFIKDMNPDFGYRFGASAGVFDFSPLPTVIAFESNFYGNTVDGRDLASEFRYDYKGWFSGWEAVFNLRNTWELKTALNIITNTDAPTGRNQGQMYSAQLRYHVQNLYSLYLEGFSFFNESDASVASYNGTVEGHNNREGYGMNLALELPKRGLRLKLRYVYTDILEDENPGLQIPFQYIGFRMEYKYEL